MNSLKEKKILVRMKQRLGEEVPQSLLDEIAEEEAQLVVEQEKQAALQEERKNAFKGMFSDLSSQLGQLMAEEKKKTAEEQALLDRFSNVLSRVDEIKAQLVERKDQTTEEFIEEIIPQTVEMIPEEIVETTSIILAPEEPPVQPPIKDPIKDVADKIKVTKPPSMFVQPDPAPVSRDIKDIQGKLKMLEGWVSKISMTGPGGGAVWLRDLDDVARSSVIGATDGQVLTYNDSTKKWEAQTISVSGSVGTLHQVTTAGNTTNNSMSANGITANHFAVNTAAGYTVSTGQIAWNAADLTFDMGMANGVTLQVGQEQHIKVKAYEAIGDGQAVMFAGASGEHILARKYDPTVNGFIPEWFIGVATQNLAVNDFGYITTFGKVNGLNTLAFTVGDILYADNATPGALTNVAPTAPNPQIIVAAVTKRAGGDGHLLVRSTWRPYLNQNNDVAITTPANGQVLTYISSSNTWINQSITGYQTTAGLSANVATLTSNNTSFVGSVSAANVVSNSQLSSNLANYQTTASLSANVATLSSNNSSYLGTLAANQYAYANGSNFSINNPITITYAGATPTGYALTLAAANTQGGAGYADFLKATNTTAGATANSKSFRLNSTGGLEIVNSGYTATIFLLSDLGALSVGSYQVNGKQAVNGPAFSAYPTSPPQTITSGSQQRVNVGNEEYDIGGCYDAANGKFQPNIEGYYQLNATVRVDGSSGTGERMITIWKNGSEYKRGTNESGTEAGASFFSLSVSCLVYANGTTDYFQVYVQQGSGANRTISEYQQISYFQGCMVRGA